MVERDPLVELLDEARTSERRAERARQRHLRQAAAEEATLAGTLIDLAERGSVVVVGTNWGAVRQGRVVGVGRDFVALEVTSGELVHLRLGAVTSLRPGPGEAHGVATGDRHPIRDQVLAEVLADAAGLGWRASITTQPNQVLVGEVLAVGAELVTLRLDGGGRDVCYVVIDSVLEAVLRSG